MLINPIRDDSEVKKSKEINNPLSHSNNVQTPNCPIQIDEEDLEEIVFEANNKDIVIEQNIFPVYTNHTQAIDVENDVILKI